MATHPNLGIVTLDTPSSILSPLSSALESSRRVSESLLTLSPLNSYESD